MTMIIPAGTSVPAIAAQDAEAETQIQSVTIAVQNTGGLLTVTDESGAEYVLDASKKKQTIEVPVGSKLQTKAAAEDGYDVATYTITTDSGTEEVEITDKKQVSHEVEVTEELRTIRTSFAESEAEDEEKILKVARKDKKMNK